LQVFTIFLQFERFQLQNFVGILRLSDLCESKLIRMPVTWCCSCRGSSENCHVS